MWDEKTLIFSVKDLETDLRTKTVVSREKHACFEIKIAEQIVVAQTHDVGQVQIKPILEETWQELHLVKSK